MPAFLQVLAVEQRGELRVREIVVPREPHQAANAFARLQRVELQVAFALADHPVGLFQHREEQVVLVAEVVVDHAHVDPGVGGDALDPRALRAVPGELGRGHLQDALARAGQILGLLARSTLGRRCRCACCLRECRAAIRHGK